MKKPCSNCPFRKDTLKGWLGKKRSTEISLAVTSDSTFHCHKTLQDLGGDELEAGPKTKPCAGSVLLSVKEGLGNRYYRYIHKDYTGGELVFDSVKHFINHHSDE